MKLNFIKASPTENMTVFVIDQIPRSIYMQAAKKIMDYNNIYAEQVGFIEKASPEKKEACVRLHMMGGEFCVNATRALACVLVQRQHYKVQRIKGKFIVPLEVSGSDKIIYCEVEPSNDLNSFIVAAKLPLPKHIETLSIKYKDTIHKGTLVEFPGIIHLVVNSEKIASKKEFFIEAKKKLMAFPHDAFGIMFYNEEESYLEPLVYVKLTESLVWERGCGSGTAALGAVFSNQLQRDIDMIVKQPGGELEVFTKWGDNKIESISLKGAVDIVAEGTLYIKISDVCREL